MEEIAFDFGRKLAHDFFSKLKPESMVFIEAADYYNMSNTDKPISNIVAVLLPAFQKYIEEIPDQLYRIFVLPYETEGYGQALYSGAIAELEDSVERIKGTKMCPKKNPNSIKRYPEATSSRIPSATSSVTYSVTIPKKPKEYLYVGVVFPTSSKVYQYISDNPDVEVGDTAVVDTKDGPITVKAVEVRYCTESDLPYPLEKTKHISKFTKAVSPEDDCNLYDDLVDYLGEPNVDYMGKSYDDGYDDAWYDSISDGGPAGWDGD